MYIMILLKDIGKTFFIYRSREIVGAVCGAVSARSHGPSIFMMMDLAVSCGTVAACGVNDIKLVQYFNRTE